MVVLMIVVVLVIVVVLMIVVFRILFWDDDVVVRLRKDFFVVTCPRNLFLRVLVLIMIIFFRIVVGVVHGVLELRFLAPCVIVVRLVVEDVDVDPAGVDHGVVLHPLGLGLDEGGLPVRGTVELIVIIIMIAILIILALVLLAILGTPLFAIIGASALWNFHGVDMDLQLVTIGFWGLAELPVLLAIPLFTFAGYLFAHTGKLSL